MDIKKNRKVAYVAPVRAVLPRNDRFETKRERAFTRLTLWFLVALAAGSAATAPLYVRYLLTDTIRFDGMILWAIGMMFVAAAASDRVVKAWNEICRTTERLDRRSALQAVIRRDLH